MIDMETKRTNRYYAVKTTWYGWYSEETVTDYDLLTARNLADVMAKIVNIYGYNGNTNELDEMLIEAVEIIPLGEEETLEITADQFDQLRKAYIGNE